MSPKPPRPRRERVKIAASELRPHALVGQVLGGRYLIEAPIGAGAMGHVFRGRHEKLRRPVAIKVLHDHFSGDAGMLARFRREAALAGRLHHRNVISVLDVCELPDGRHAMVMDLAEGQPLTRLMGEPQPRARIVNLVRQLLLGLDHAHGEGLIHRDLKPDNVLVRLTDDGEEVPQIVDFGVAILRGPDDGTGLGRLTAPGMVVGTPQYMAPEQAKDEPIDHRVDLFAAGVILYELLAGRPPFDGDTPLDICLANISRDPPAIQARAPTAPAPDPLLEAFMRRLMARKVDRRLANAHAALALLDLIERDPGSAAIALLR